MKYQLYKSVMKNEKRRRAFDQLAVQTFKLSFDSWYQSGYWSESNMPYTLFDGERAISNISVNRMEIMDHGRLYNCIQLGTVMTDKEYRNQGLSRLIMDEVLCDWKEQSDAIFLFANKSVLDFYPRFGFEKRSQYRYSMTLEECAGDARKLNMDSLADRELLERYYLKKNPYSQIQAVHNFGLLMFYCISVMKDCVWYSEAADAVIIAEKKGSVLNCFEIFCIQGKDMKHIISSAATEGIETVDFKFTPNRAAECSVTLLENESDTLFVLKDESDVFDGGKIIFPELSHT